MRAWLFPALERAGLVVLADDLRTFDPRPHDRLRKLRVLSLQPDAIRVPSDQVLHQHLASDVVFLSLGDGEVDLEERGRVPVEHRCTPSSTSRWMSSSQL